MLFSERLDNNHYKLFGRFLCNDSLVAAVLFSVLFCVYSYSKVITSSDSMWSIFVARSIIHDGDTNLREYLPQIRHHKRFAIEKYNQAFYNFFPPGPALFATPFVALYENLPASLIEKIPGFSKAGDVIKAHPNNAIYVRHELERFVASVITASTAVLLYFISRNYSGLITSLLISVLYGFGTSAWSTTSRALWQHAPSAFLLTATLMLFIISRKRHILAGFCGVVLMLAYVVRPTNLLSILVWAVLIFRHRRSGFLFYCCAVLVCGAIFCIWSELNFGTILPKYFNPSRSGTNPDLIMAVAANLVSPSRGIFVFSPWLLFSLWSFVPSFSIKIPVITPYLWVIIILHLLTVSSFGVWWGGHSYGPRFMSDITPFLSLLTLPAISEIINKSFHTWKCGLAVLVATSIFSLWTHTKGATSFAGVGWNVVPRNVDTLPMRVWDWNDPQWARN